MREMKKIDYQAPEMEIVELKNQLALLAGSTEAEFGDPEEL